MTDFQRITKEQFKKDFESIGRSVKYDDIILPKRSTKYSAGYDFFLPFDLALYPGECVKIPTGIRIVMPLDRFLMIVPRSGLGTKFRFQLDNTVGIIDADYCLSENEGHIWIKMRNDSMEGRTIALLKGTAFAQGIILPYFTTDDDQASDSRNGGFGSTGE